MTAKTKKNKTANNTKLTTPLKGRPVNLDEIEWVKKAGDYKKTKKRR